jgi:hypothetical protein
MFIWIVNIRAKASRQAHFHVTRTENGVLHFLLSLRQHSTSQDRLLDDSHLAAGGHNTTSLHVCQMRGRFSQGEGDDGGV